METINKRSLSLRGNSNAAKPEDKQKNENVIIRLTAAEKAALELAVGAGNISAFLREKIAERVSDSTAKPAAIPAGDQAGKAVFLHIEITQAEKNAYVRAAKPGKLSDWVRKHLNDASAGAFPQD